MMVSDERAKLIREVWADTSKTAWSIMSKGTHVTVALPRKLSFVYSSNPADIPNIETLTYTLEHRDEDFFEIMCEGVSLGVYKY